MMKKTAAVTAALLCAMMLVCCNKNGGGSGQTEAPKPTEAAPQIPTPGRLGNLIGGELFPEPAEYLVLKGEGDLYYAYDRMGELVALFPSYGLYSGFYGRDGIVGDFSLRLMKNMDDWQVFGQLMLHTVDDELIEFLDCYTDKTVQVKSQGLSIGELGGVLPFEDGYLLLEAYDDYSDEYGQYLRYARCVWLDKNGDIAGEFDPEPFGQIRGVYGAKHIMAVNKGEAYEAEGHFKTKIYSLSGEVLLEDIEPASDAVYYIGGRALQGREYECRLMLDNYAFTENERWYDSDLNPLKTPPEDAYEAEYNRMRRSIELEDRIVIGDNSVNAYSSLPGLEASRGKIRIYVGVKDGEGNWLFKIYNPALASDSRRKSMWG